MMMALGGSLLPGCSGERQEPGEEAVHSRREALKEATDDANNLYSMTGQLSTSLTNGHTGRCTASLLSCSVGVTAAHCFEDGPGITSKQGDTSDDFVLEHLSAKNTLALHALEKSADTVAVLSGDIMRRTRQYIGKETRQNPLDIAVFSLKEPMMLPQYAEIADLTSTTEINWDAAEITVVGYGEGVKRRYAHGIAELGLNFAQLPVAWSETMEQGDSGGPMFIRNLSKGFRIIGVGHGKQTGLPAYYASVSTTSDMRAWVLGAVERLTVDSDGDGVPDVCDSCPNDPRVWRADAIDSDGDGIPDACDDFPCSPDDPGDLADPDKDGIPSSCDPNAVDKQGRAAGFCRDWCARHPVDNCPSKYNRDQANCNADAEKVVRAVPMGDICDPVPCPDGEPLWKRLGVIEGDDIYAPPTLNSPGLSVSTVHVGLDRFIVEKLWNAPMPMFHPDALADRMLDVAYRYCHPVLNRVWCNDDAVISDYFLHAPESEESSRSFWHIVHAGHDAPQPTGPMAPGLPNDPAEVARNYGCTDTGPMPACLNPTVPNYEVRWDYKHDFAKWAARWEDGPKLYVGQSGWSQDGGRFWFHVDTTVGMTHDEYPIRPMLDPNEVAHGLANHYTYTTPEYRYQVVRTTPPLLSLIPRNPYDFTIPCFECARKGLDIQRPPFAVNPREMVVLASVQTVAGRFTGFVSPEGEIWTGDNLLSEAVVASLSDPSLRWLSPVEADPLAGRGVGNPAMVAVSADGTSIARSLEISANGFVLSGVDGPPDGTGGQSNADQTVAPRSGFASIYVRSMGLVFLVGGQDPSVPSSEGPVVAIDVATGDRMPQRLSGYTPGNVVAATYSVQDRSLWVIEEVRKNSQQLWVQMVRLAVPGGSAQVFGPWPRLKHHDKLWLATDLEGGIVLVASSQKLAQYSVQGVREQGGKLKSDWIHRGNKATLGGGPILDSSGLRLMLSTGEIVRVMGFDSLVASGGNGNCGNNGNGNSGNNGNGSGCNSGNNGNGNSGSNSDAIAEALK